MSEIKLQSEIAVEFSQRFPHLRGQFFHVSNERNSPKQAFIARSIGIIPGVSDFIYFDFEPFSGIILMGLEIKKPGTKHQREHIEQQLEWARLLESKGGIWRLVRSVDEALSTVQGDYKGLTIADVQKMLDSTKNKLILF